MKRLTLVVDEASKNLRLDKFLSDRAQISRGEAKRTLARGGVWVSGKRVKSESRAVMTGQKVEIHLITSEEAAHRENVVNAFNVDRILFQDASVIAVNKPPLLPSQPTPDSDVFDVVSLSSRLVGTELFPLHRLDKETSGVVVLAKDKTSATRLSQAFQNRQVHKTYLALVAPADPSKRPLSWIRRVSSLNDEFDVDLPIAPDPMKPGRMKAVHEDEPMARGKGRRYGPQTAVTRVRVLQRFTSGVLLIEACPETGRMHQIRVHLASLGFPLLGDGFYGGASKMASVSVGRVMLHAKSLQFSHPKTAKDHVVEASIPEDFSALLHVLSPLDSVQI